MECEEGEVPWQLAALQESWAPHGVVSTEEVALKGGGARRGKEASLRSLGFEKLKSGEGKVTTNCKSTRDKS